VCERKHGADDEAPVSRAQKKSTRQLAAKAASMAEGDDRAQHAEIRGNVQARAASGNTPLHSAESNGLPSDSMVSFMRMCSMITGGSAEAAVDQFPLGMAPSLASLASVTARFQQALGSSSSSSSAMKTKQRPKSTKAPVVDPAAQASRERDDKKQRTCKATACTSRATKTCVKCWHARYCRCVMVSLIIVYPHEHQVIIKIHLSHQTIHPAILNS
jgi:hypothetical protein